MAAPRSEKAPPTSRSSGDLTLAVLLFEKCLDWCQKHRSARTYEGYVGHIQAFCDHLKTATQMPALDLKPFHIIEWLDAHPTWGPAFHRNAVTAVQRAFNWAEELGHIATNPIRKIKKPAAKRREHFITPTDWEAIRNHIRRATRSASCSNSRGNRGAGRKRLGTLRSGTSTSIGP